MTHVQLAYGVNTGYTSNRTVLYQYEMLHKIPRGPVRLPLVPCRLFSTSTGTSATMDNDVTHAITAMALTNRGTPGAA